MIVAQKDMENIDPISQRIVDMKVGESSTIKNPGAIEKIKAANEGRLVQCALVIDEQSLTVTKVRLTAVEILLNFLT